MNKKAFLLYIILFSLGWTLSGAYFYISSPAVAYATGNGLNMEQPVTEKTQSETMKILENKLYYDVQADKDIPSPSSRIKIEDISVYDNEVVLKVNNPKWAVFTDTKSMDPVIDSTSKAIEIIPHSPEDIRIGDIVAYNSKYVDGIVAHRVVETGYDNLGWYARLKGDNNNNADPENVRMQQIKGVVAAIIY